MIVVEKLTKQFKGQVVLNGIDLEVKEGEVIAIIGPSGSGKTTFLRCLNFLEQPTSGRIKVGDIEIDSSKPINQQASLVRRLRQHVGFVFQSFNLFPTALRWKMSSKGPPWSRRCHGKRLTPWVASCWPGSVWRARRTRIPGVCRAASNSAWRLPVRWPWSRR